MVFSSVIFLFGFLPGVLLAYFLIPRGWRNLLLLLASLLFYFWGEGGYVVIMLLYMVFNWFFGITLEAVKRKENGVPGPGAKTVLALALTFNLGFLLYYKYFNFFIANLNKLLALTSHHIAAPNVHLPIGISFFTFQAISYVLDVYRGDVKAQANLIDFSMYKALFPQLIAGPIVRYRDIAAQVKERHVDFAKFAAGAQRFILGLGKKVIIANTVAETADRVFALSGGDLSSGVAWLGLICYALQIYFDFSGYSDMAIGLGKMFGFDFLENFNFPYISRSIKEFWRRWHISLSSWFRDYLYIPLGGNRSALWRTYANQVIVFFLCGLWHGASWTFVIWGLWHGAFLVIERTRFGVWLNALPGWAARGYTLGIVIIGWVFFRTEGLKAAGTFLQAMAGLGHGSARLAPYLTLKLVIAIALGVVGSTPAIRNLLKALEPQKGITAPGAPDLAWHLEQGLLLASLVGILFLSTILISDATYNPFIYFRF
jgi:alginate O-acetyltransferase complex protein AlgI